MKTRGKKYNEMQKIVDREKRYTPNEALKIYKEWQGRKFDETVEAHFNLGIDPRHADQQIRGTLVLPHGTGKTLRVVVITQGEKLSEAKAAGADVVGAEDVMERIQGGWFDFDLIIATPDMMSKLGKLGRILGTKGLMPSPKSGTVTLDIAKAVKEFKSGKIEYRNDKNSIVHAIIGKSSFTEKQLLENFETLCDTIVKIKPSKSKGIYLKSVSLCGTMSPGIFIDTLKLKGKD